MNRTEMIDAVARGANLTKREAEAALDSVVYQIAVAVKAGEPVRLVGFGTFELRERKARKGRNPQTNESVAIKASKSIGFRPGAKLKADLTGRAAIPKPRSLGGTATPRGSAAPRPAPTSARGASGRAGARRVTASAPPAARRSAAKTAPATASTAKPGTRASAKPATRPAPRVVPLSSARTAARTPAARSRGVAGSAAARTAVKRATKRG